VIRPCGALPPLGGLCGAKLETLFACYRDVPAIAAFYEGEGFFCGVFGGRLTVCGMPEAEELAAFAAFLGAREIEGEALPALPQGARAEYPILRWTGEKKAIPLPETDDYSAAYEILCASDGAFRAESERLPWISDLRRRTNRGRAAVCLRDGAAVVVTAQSDSLAVLGAVACRPEARGKGAASALVRDASASLCARGRTPVTAAASEALAGWYERLGFARAGALALLTLDRAP